MTADTERILPLAASAPGAIRIIEKVGTDPYVVTILPSGSDTVGGLPFISLTNNGDHAYLVSDGVSNWLAIVGVGGSTATPAGVVAIAVVGTIDPLSNMIALSVGVTPPSSGLAGCHLYLEIPDQSAIPTVVVGSTPVGGPAAIAGAWTTIDLGKYPYILAQQPWSVSVLAPASTNVGVATQCRLYAASYSPNADNVLVRAGTSGATPNQTFLLTPQASPSRAAGTNVTATSGSITASVLSLDNSTGVSRTPILVTVSSVPSIPGWVGELVITWGTSDPTQIANQQVVGNVFNIPGPVYGAPGGIPSNYSFEILTPTAFTPLTIWAVAGLVDNNGAYAWNNVVPGITPCAVVIVGALNGRTIDGTAITAESIAIDHFAAGIRPVAIFSAEPALPDGNYPGGTFGFNVVTGVFEKVSADGSAWVPAVNASAIDATILSAAEVAAGFASFSYLAANYATLTQLTAQYVDITGLLTASYATITSLNAATATITGQLNATVVTVNELTASNATITGELSAQALTIAGLATIAQLNATNATVAGILAANYLTAQNLSVALAELGTLTTGNLDCGGTLDVVHDAHFEGNLLVSLTANLNGNVVIGGTCEVDGMAYLQQAQIGSLTVPGTVAVAGAMTVGGAITVTGATPVAVQVSTPTGTATLTFVGGILNALTTP